MADTGDGLLPGGFAYEHEYAAERAAVYEHDAIEAAIETAWNDDPIGADDAREQYAALLTEVERLRAERGASRETLAKED